MQGINSVTPPPPPPPLRGLPAANSINSASSPSPAPKKKWAPVRIPSSRRVWKRDADTLTVDATLPLNWDQAIDYEKSEDGSAGNITFTHNTHYALQ